MNDADALLRLGVAALGGLAVGIEREWSGRREKSNTRFGGVRTFLLLGLAGGVSGLLADQGKTGVAIGLLAAASAVVVAAYAVTAWQGTIDATTEVAGVVALAGGFLAGSGWLAVASAVFAATALVLVEKGRMHEAVDRLKGQELEAAARFAVLALVVLPLLPVEPVEWLGGLTPRKLWSLVLLFSGLSFAGYVALRAAGPKRGLGLAGLLGGIVSSTAVTLNFARESRGREEVGPALAAGVLAASAVMPVRVGVLSFVLNREVGRALLPAAAAAALLGAVFVVRVLLKRGKESDDGEVVEPGNPLRLFAAIQMAAMFAVVLFLLDQARDRFGSTGLYGGAVLLGLTDLDALTLTMNRQADAGLAPDQAARALALGMLANSLFKAGVALAVGAGRFRWLAAGGLALYAAVFGAAVLLR